MTVPARNNIERYSLRCQDCGAVVTDHDYGRPCAFCGCNWAISEANWEALAANYAAVEAKYGKPDDSWPPWDE